MSEFDWTALAQADVDRLMDGARARLRELGVTEDEFSVLSSSDGWQHVLRARDKPLFEVTVSFVPGGGFDVRTVERFWLLTASPASGPASAE